MQATPIVSECALATWPHTTAAACAAALTLLACSAAGPVLTGLSCI